MTSLSFKSLSTTAYLRWQCVASILTHTSDIARGTDQPRRR
jgi:hypothetical protein